MIEELVSRVFALRNAAHLAHWGTKSYAEHVALCAFYGALIGEIDTIVEAYQGWYGLIGDIRPLTVPKGGITDRIKEDLIWISKNRDGIARNNAMMAALIDNLMALYSSTHYKLANLS